MPDLCRFRGIVIRMRANDHPPPHFHVFYGEHSASMEIGTGAVMKGWLPPRIRRMVEAWAAMRQNELRFAWQQLSAGHTPDKIAPPN